MSTQAELEVINAKGQTVKAHVFADPNGSLANKFMFAMGRLTGKAGESNQLDRFDRGGLLAQKLAVVRPPVLPEMYAELYRKDPTNRACIDAKVRSVAMQGWQIRPRNQVSPAFDGGGAGEPVTGDLDYAVRDAIIEVFENSMPEFSFTTMMAAVWTDVEAEGDGYVEILRKNNGKIHAFLPTKAVTMRIARHVPGYVQIRGQHKRWFAQYGYDYDAIVLERENRKAATSDDGRFTIEADPVFLPKNFTKAKTGDMIAKAGGDLGELMGAAVDDGAEVQVSANEMIRFSVATPKDTVYGEPPILSAIEDFLTAQNIRMFMLSYFDNATIPRMAIFVKGSDALTSETVGAIETWIKSQNKLDALNEVLVVEVGEGSDVQIEKLSSEQLGDGGSFLECRQAADRSIAIAHHTPPSIIFDIYDLNNAVSKEADRRFIETVVRPKQRMIEDQFNYVIQQEFGTRDWVLDLKVPDLTELDSRRQLWQMLLTRGAVTINEVRRELQLGDVEGGDVPFLLVPGQGLATLKNISEGGVSEVSTPDNPPVAGGQMGATGKATSHEYECAAASAAEVLGLTLDQIKEAFPQAMISADAIT